MRSDDNNDVLVWLNEYRAYGALLREGTHTALVSFMLDGETVQEEVENDEWEFWEDHVSEQWTD